jgi:ABC-type multidrug transport system fused ATPase/permease subunit
MNDNDLTKSALPPSGTWTGDALFKHFTTRHDDIKDKVDNSLSDLQEQMNRRIQTQANERADTEKHLLALIDGVRRESESTTDSSRIAVSEAGVEREKAAQALASALRESIRESQERMREHVDNQIETINNVIASARREANAANEAAKEAIKKAEDATDKRFDAHNAFREESTEHWNKTMPREAAETALFALEKRLDKAERDLDKRMGAESAIDRRKQAVQPWQIWLAGAALAVIIVIVNILTVLGGPP